MAYTKIAAIGEGTTNQTMPNPCNIQTLNNVIMLCDDITLTNYTANTPLFTLSDSSMFPASELNIPVFVTDTSTTPNVFFIIPLVVATDGKISIHTSFTSAILHTNGICFHVNGKYYNQTIGNTDPSLFPSPLNGV